MSEQSPQANSQETSIEDRILNLIDPQEDNEKEEEQQAEPKADESQDSHEQPEEKKAEGEEQLPEVEEIEIEGEKVKVPKHLKQKIEDGFLRQSDYTRKTQEAAEKSKAAEALMQQLQEQGKLQKASSKIYGKIASLDDQIAQYEKVDWNALTAQDASLAQRHFIQFQTLKDARGKAEGELKSVEEQFRQEANKVLQSRLEEGVKALQRDIKGWGPELGQKLMSFAMKTYGYSAEETASVTDPKMVKLIHDAYELHQLRASKPLEKKVPVVTKTLTPKSADSRDPNQQSYDADRRAVKSAKTDYEKAKAVERLMLRKI